MASSVENIIKNSRPEGFKGRIDRYLPKIGLGLKELILKVRDDLTYLGDEIDSNCVDHLAAMCILFGEDLHCRLGLWRAVEKWNVDVFNTPLPFLVPEGERDVELKKFDERRVQFFLWQVLTDYLDNEESTLNINPNHIELNLLAHTVAEFLANRFSPKLPQNSGIGRLLNLAHPEAPDLKRKLVWLGTQSYLFSSYAPPKDFQSVDEYKHWIELVDDYICQECSRWSGMGPLEVLAGALQLDAQDKEDLMAWAYRLYAPYEVLSLTRKGGFVESIEALNLLNQQT
jgi:hypothetical protein